jgi:septal ring factor EnvC (AmiA/AmiB activator)
MKIFDSSPGITLERPSRRRRIAAIAAAVTVCLALAGALVYQHKAHSSELAKVNGDLAASRAEVARLQGDLAATKGKLDAATLNIDSCASNLTAETSKVAAFAKQAAACEVIRNKLHVKG